MGVYAESMNLNPCVYSEGACSNKNRDLSSNSTMMNHLETVGQTDALQISVSSSIKYDNYSSAAKWKKEP